MLRILSTLALLSVGTALTNSTAETVLQSHSLPANSLQPGKIYDVDAAVTATATNSTDTLLVNVRIGGTTLTGTIVGAAAATDVANSDKVIVRLRMAVVSVSAAGVAEVVVWGSVSAPGAEGTATMRAAFERLTTLTATAAILVEVTGTWSVASASNSCRAECMTVTELGA